MRFVLFILIFIHCTCSLDAQIESSPKAKVIDSLLTICYNNGTFNGVALVADQGEVILHDAYGFSELDSRTPLQLTDRFCIGSMTKQFTSVLILQLQDSGLLDVHEPLSDYLPEFSEKTFADITLHHLLTHTSGLGNFTSHPDFDKSRPYTEQEMFAFIKHPLLFKAGTEWSYSNSGYYLLGKIAERVTKQKYGNLLEEKIFGPLGMESSSFDPIWPVENAAHGHQRTVKGMAPMPTYALSTLLSTGGIFSTAQDLFLWAQAMDGNSLLSAESKEILLNPILNDYACGLFVKRGRDENGREFERYFHGGMIQGYHAFMLKRIPQKQVVILLDNCYNQEIPTIKNRIWSALVEEDVKPVKPKLSNLLYRACSGDSLAYWMDAIASNPMSFEDQYTVEEYDTNTVAYRLMEAERYEEAELLFAFNIKHHPQSWNVYDSMGELYLKQGAHAKAKKMYSKSLELNSANTSAARALEKIMHHK